MDIENIKLRLTALSRSSYLTLAWESLACINELQDRLRAADKIANEASDKFLDLSVKYAKLADEFTELKMQAISDFGQYQETHYELAKFQNIIDEARKCEPIMYSCHHSDNSPFMGDYFLHMAGAENMNYIARNNEWTISPLYAHPPMPDKKLLNTWVECLTSAAIGLCECHDNNTGNEPSISCYHRALDEFKEIVADYPKF